MRTGDLLIERAMIRGKQTAFPGTLQYVYSSVPAPPTPTRPVIRPARPTQRRASARGSRLNGFPVADGPDRDPDIEVTLTFWRPQRRPIPGEKGRWTDIGHRGALRCE